MLLKKISPRAIAFEKPAFTIEWKLLLFLILFMDVKLVVKAFALIFIYFMRPDFNFGFRTKDSRLPLFYLIVVLIAILNFIFYHNFSGNYVMVALTGVLIWIACILAIHQIKLFVERTDIEILHNTLLVFFILNIAFSLLNLTVILIDTGFRNPFLFAGQYQKYFINTGDFIKGITGDTSVTNALINCFGIVYFLYQKKYLLVLACMTILLMTASNFSNIILLLVFIGIFLFKSIKEQKSIVVICIMTGVLFLIKFSPQNENYLTATLSKYFTRLKENIITPKKEYPLRETPDSLLSPEDRKAKFALLLLDSLDREEIKLSGLTVKQVEMIAVKRPEIPKDKLQMPSFQWKRDTTLFQRQLYSYIQSEIPNPVFNYPDRTPGKILAWEQSLHFLNEHRTKIIAGNGMGNFSSKLAFRATGLKWTGGFPHRFLYCNPDFLNNHLNLYAYFYLKTPDAHSIIHSPGSVYDQLITEYGFIGFFAFPVYYLGFFLRHLKKLSYGLPALFLLAAFFLVDYWFEQLSVVILFELMMFMNIKQHTQSTGIMIHKKITVRSKSVSIK